jgi:hypothetical protein
MVQPFDYTLKTPSTTESFLAGLQSYQNQQKAMAAQAAAEASARVDQNKIDEANRFRERAKVVAKDPSAANLSALYADFRTFGVDIDRFAKSLSENDKRTFGTIFQDAIIAKRNGRPPEEIAAIYAKGADAAKTSNRPDMVEKFSVAKDIAMNPNMNDDFTARSYLFRIDPDAYEMIQESEVKLDTATIKELEAEGFVRGTPEFREALRRERTKVSTTLPGGGFYSGTEEGLALILGGQPAPTAVQKGPPRRPTTKEEYEKLPPGAFYIDPDGVTRQKPGGQTATPSGNFQGQ